MAPPSLSTLTSTLYAGTDAATLKETFTFIDGTPTPLPLPGTPLIIVQISVPKGQSESTATLTNAADHTTVLTLQAQSVADSLSSVWLIPSGYTFANAAASPSTPTATSTSLTTRLPATRSTSTGSSSAASSFVPVTSVSCDSNVGLQAGIGVLAGLLALSLAANAILLYKYRQFPPAGSSDRGSTPRKSEYGQTHRDLGLAIGDLEIARRDRTLDSLVGELDADGRNRGTNSAAGELKGH